MQKTEPSYVTIIGVDNIVVQNAGADDIFLKSAGFTDLQDGRFKKEGLVGDQLFETIRILIENEVAFSHGRDWSPSEILKYYRDNGKFIPKYVEISWSSKDDPIFRLI